MGLDWEWNGVMVMCEDIWYDGRERRYDIVNRGIGTG